MTRMSQAEVWAKIHEAADEAQYAKTAVANGDYATATEFLERSASALHLLAAVTRRMTLEQEREARHANG